MAGQRRALLSVANKQGIVEFARALAERGFELVSTGGTAKALRAAELAVTEVAAITGFPEIMDGRVKTLHPLIHGGLLARSGLDDAVLAEHRIGLIDLLAVNLYPFEETVASPAAADADAIENIDVGGPAMLRAAAKNHERVTVVVEPADYDRVLAAFAAGAPSAALRRELAAIAFAHTARYDAAIASYLRGTLQSGSSWPGSLAAAWNLVQPLRYGENPHQRAAWYRSAEECTGTVAQAEQLQGKELSFNNLVDADAALQCAMSFGTAACAIVKHANPCGVAVGASPAAAYELAYRTDPTSAFGGVIAFNRALDESAAEAIVGRQFAEVIVAPEVTAVARAVVARKASIRVLRTGPRAAPGAPSWEPRAIEGGLLVQEPDRGEVTEQDLRTVTTRAPTPAELDDLRFAWSVAKFVKSNAIVYARGGATLGIGAGQPSRVMSVRIAALKAQEQALPLEGAVMASDAFFPFRDGIDTAAAHGIRAVIHPGGSVRDQEIVAAANEHGMAMVLTGMRHFRH
jgi:phosphoribosylaminoimidazolecarboxamide formyltransferase/IMP cyclohydrolase